MTRVFTLISYYAWDAVTIPPFGIFIKREYRDVPEVLAHQLVHWGQYKRLGLWKYHWLYAKGYISAWQQHGRRNAHYMNKMELEAYDIKNH